MIVHEKKYNIMRRRSIFSNDVDKERIDKFKYYINLSYVLSRHSDEALRKMSKGKLKNYFMSLSTPFLESIKTIKKRFTVKGIKFNLDSDLDRIRRNLYGGKWFLEWSFILQECALTILQLDYEIVTDKKLKNVILKAIKSGKEYNDFIRESAKQINVEEVGASEVKTHEDYIERVDAVCDVIIDITMNLKINQ